MWREWEKYKVALEASRSPEFMLICEKWEELKFISREEMARCVSRHACAFAKHCLANRMHCCASIHNRLWPMILSFTTEEKKMLGLIGMSNADVSAPLYFLCPEKPFTFDDIFCPEKPFTYILH